MSQNKQFPKHFGRNSCVRGSIMGTHREHSGMTLGAYLRWRTALEALVLRQALENMRRAVDTFLGQRTRDTGRAWHRNHQFWLLGGHFCKPAHRANISNATTGWAGGPNSKYIPKNRPTPSYIGGVQELHGRLGGVVGAEPGHRSDRCRLEILHDRTGVTVAESPDPPSQVGLNRIAGKSPVFFCSKPRG